MIFYRAQKVVGLSGRPLLRAEDRAIAVIAVIANGCGRRHRRCDCCLIVAIRSGYYRIARTS